MTRRPALSEMLWPMDEESLAQAQSWVEDMSTQVLDLTWRAFDQLRTKHLSKINFQQSLEQLERDLVSKHFICIQQMWKQETDGWSSVVPHHEYPENETRPPAPGRPPAYDLAFVWNDNQRVAWPIEAKVVPTAKTLADYMGDVKKFVSGTGAPLTSQGGLIAYLLKGHPAEFFVKLEDLCGMPLGIVRAFSCRPHRISRHERDPAPVLDLHHMVMVCS